MAQGCTVALGCTAAPPPEVYRGPCMKNMRQNQGIIFTDGLDLQNGDRIATIDM